MSLSAVNSADEILVIEGRTDLPSGAKLEAELQSRDGKTLLRDTASVSRGSFFFDFDLGRLSEFSSYQVLVTFDPVDAPLGVRQLTGLWGEALEGPGVRQLSDRRVFGKEQAILLSASAKGEEWEGRDFESMEANMRSRLIDELENYTEAKPDDKSAKLALARAYIADNSREYSAGSRAHILLTDVARSTATDRDGNAARELLAQIEESEEKKQKVQTQREAVASGAKYRNDFVILPGTALGGFKLGSPYSIATRYFKLKEPADFQQGTGDQVVRLADFHGVELTYGLLSRRLIAARTTSPLFKLPENYGVGSLLQELQQAYGVAAVYTPKWVPAGTTPDGKQVFTGVVNTDGLEFEIRRTVDNVFGIPVDKVSAITVFRP